MLYPVAKYPIAKSKSQPVRQAVMNVSICPTKTDKKKQKKDMSETTHFHNVVVKHLDNETHQHGVLVVYQTIIKCC